RMNGVARTLTPFTVSKVSDFGGSSPARSNVTRYCDVRLAAMPLMRGSRPDGASVEYRLPPLAFVMLSSTSSRLLFALDPLRIDTAQSVAPELATLSAAF